MIRIAILQSDSSHSETFIGLINGPGSRFAGRARVTALWGEDEIQVREKATLGVKPCASIADAAADADLLMVCGRWGDSHYPVALEALKAGKPLFIDKPVTNDLTQARDLLARIAQAGVPAMSCSAFRFAPEILALQDACANLGGLRMGSSAGLSEWAAFGERGTDIFFYGVHIAEMFHAAFGPGAEAVRIDRAPGGDVATFRWPDGRLATMHLLRDCAEIYEVRWYGEKGHAHAAIGEDSDYYGNLLDAIIRMGETGIPPLPLNAAVEIVAMLEAIKAARKNPGWVSIEATS